MPYISADDYTITIDDFFLRRFWPHFSAAPWPGDDQHETEGEGGVSGEHQGVDLGRFGRFLRRDGAFNGLV